MSNPIISGNGGPILPSKSKEPQKISTKPEKIAKETISSHESESTSLSDRSISDESSENERDFEAEFEEIKALYKAFMKKNHSEKKVLDYGSSQQLESQKKFLAQKKSSVEKKEHSKEPIMRGLPRGTKQGDMQHERLKNSPFQAKKTPSSQPKPLPAIPKKPRIDTNADEPPATMPSINKIKKISPNKFGFNK